MRCPSEENHSVRNPRKFATCSVLVVVVVGFAIDVALHSVFVSNVYRRTIPACTLVNAVWVYV
ncbi:hypothetical protein FBUS_00537 [Fasciolopsis buskii]|uniref:Uncharacterized protein n=1 Tax=Fasciolopsis buskii TaxID=27845 RepID=A0A8E0VNY3_9TREM|nr:hypothetical protein FBUS_00537 [Fasciolopsis buski]